MLQFPYAILVTFKGGLEMFNDYIWNTYLKADGKEIVKIFEDAFTKKFTSKYINKINELQKSYSCNSLTDMFLVGELQKVKLNLDKGFSILQHDTQSVYSANNVMKSFYALIQGDENLPATNVFGYFANNIEVFSTFLAIELPELFVPYYFKCIFNLIEKIANEFEIELPQIPLKKDYEGRFYYFGKVCEVLHDFRKKHNMSPYELFAFLYDFAPKYIGGRDSYIIKTEVLPEPKSAYFIGGSKDDAGLSNVNDTICAWQCSPDTRAGDMIVMYLRTPVSAITSIWRSVSVGFNDPFFYYYRCTYIAKPVSIKHIPLKVIKEDKIFKEMCIVKKNMFGINGVELLPLQYNHVVELTGANVPKLEFISSYGDLTLTREKDVEDKLVKPLLKKLDYSDDEYEQQLYIEIGNHNHALIPDFVLLPVKERGRQSAFALVEAKLTIPNLAKLEDVKIQARSYSRQLNTGYSVIASKEKLWVMTQDDDYTKDIFSSSWDMLKNADNFAKLYKLIGNKNRPLKSGGKSAKK